MSKCICGEINARNCPVHQMIEFDENAAEAEYQTFNDIHPAWSERNGFIEGARWQFDQLKAEQLHLENDIRNLEEKNEYLEVKEDEAHQSMLTMTDEITALKAENAELQAKLWVANDSKLRTYDGLAQKADKVDEVLNYCTPHIDMMWAASIVGMILDCDFRDAASELKKRELL